jgi:hypothetical protein
MTIIELIQQLTTKLAEGTDPQTKVHVAAGGFHWELQSISVELGTETCPPCVGLYSKADYECRRTRTP